MSQAVREREHIDGTARPSLALEYLQETEKLDEPDRSDAEKTLAGALGSIYIAGADTTVSSMVTFLIACMAYPELQKMARDEIDAVVGRKRPQTFEDRPRLPFVDAMCKAVLRWRPVLPIAAPHAAVDDGFYDGFFIPKGALVIGNTWALFHDPSVCLVDPDAFKPERFLNPDGSLRDDTLLSSAFNYGKRICPGRHFVDATLFIYAASLLSIFLTKKMHSDQEGQSEYKYTGSMLRKPPRIVLVFHYSQG
ncbi:O-methylsterigmatocystin oxidoreductase [Lactarius tabidus]